ncbi:uncharacterized protein [Oscarella lobularis]|uniref:uncharacterized protein n=1 Tax=Oscarella lobularis TaxID=121494 RepID=UPI0033132BDD
MATVVKHLSLLLAFGLSFAGGSPAQTWPVPSRFPEFSWDTVPVFCHMCKPGGLFNDTELKFLTRFPIVTIEKGQGVNETGYAEDKMIAAAKQIKSAQKSVWTLFYMNAILDWEFYHLHEIMLQHPEYWLRDDNGNVIRRGGDHSFPQSKDGMLIFDQTKKVVRDVFTSDCVNSTMDGAFDGCFVDRANWALRILDDGGSPLKNVSTARIKELANGQVQLLSEMQTALTDSRIVIAKDVGGAAGFTDWPYVDAIFLSDCYCCSSTCARDIEAAINATKRGQLLQCHVDGKLNDHDNFIFHLSTFLIVAGNHSYFAYSEGWYLESYGLKWWPEYSKPLGSPLGPANCTGTVYQREFSSGTHVWVDIETKKGNITWGTK